MNHLELIALHSRKLPESLQKEVLDFACFLEARYAEQTEAPSHAVSEADIKQACGVLKAPHGVTLEEMDAAIRARGGRL
jgi:hypothetical protein